MNEGLANLLPFLVIFVLFYFMLIRPQMKQAKAHKLMLDELKSGDEVSTSGGILGKGTKINNQFAIIEVSKDVELKIHKQTIQTKLEKGTIKSI